MAGKITHIEVLGQTIKHLHHGTQEEKEIADLLSNSNVRNYGNLGAVAPDIFYYYHFLSPVRSTKAQIWGDLHHHKNVAELVLQFLDQILQMEDNETKEKLTAFTFGYICHCAVDVVTHPYIFYISGDYYSSDPKIASLAQFNHLRVEFALDSYLLNYRWGMSPRMYDFNQYVDIRKKDNFSKMDPNLWAFWQNALKAVFSDEVSQNYIGSDIKIIPGDLLNDSYIGFLGFHKLLDSRSNTMRGILKIIDIVTFNKIKSSVLMLPNSETIDIRIMNEEKRPWYFPADPNKVKRESFIELINKAANSSKEAITTAKEYLNGNVKRETILKDYGGYNLDTGIRSEEIQNMVQFAPLD
jgi:hypothetical protein